MWAEGLIHLICLQYVADLIKQRKVTNIHTYATTKVMFKPLGKGHVKSPSGFPRNWREEIQVSWCQQSGKKQDKTVERSALTAKSWIFLSLAVGLRHPCGKWKTQPLVQMICFMWSQMSWFPPSATRGFENKVTTEGSTMRSDRSLYEIFLENTEL